MNYEYLLGFLAEEVITQTSPPSNLTKEYNHKLDYPNNEEVLLILALEGMEDQDTEDRVV